MNDTKPNIFHMKFLKYILGVTKSCPTFAILGKTGEIPLMLKGYRLMIKYWHRINNLPNETLVKKALLENISLRTNWIVTIERLTNYFKLTDSIQNANKLNRNANKNMQASYTSLWDNSLNSDISRLNFYRKIKKEFGFETYLNIPDFRKRKAITKLRCSDHDLEIEKGRHKKVPREGRFCKLCGNINIETEEHFLAHCEFYGPLKSKYEISGDLTEIINSKNLEKLGEYLITAFDERNAALQAREVNT